MNRNVAGRYRSSLDLGSLLKNYLVFLQAIEQDHVVTAPGALGSLIVV